MHSISTCTAHQLIDLGRNPSIPVGSTIWILLTVCAQQQPCCMHLAENKPRCAQRKKFLQYRVHIYRDVLQVAPPSFHWWPVSVTTFLSARSILLTLVTACEHAGRRNLHLAEHVPSSGNPLHHITISLPIKPLPTVRCLATKGFSSHSSCTYLSRKMTSIVPQMLLPIT